jgi:hypothetical protein
MIVQAMRHWRMTIVLAALCAGAPTLTAHLLSAVPAVPDDATSGAAKTPSQTAAPVFSLPGKERFAEIEARPVFRITRRPASAEPPPPPPPPVVVAAPPPPPPPPAPPPPSLRQTHTLIGIVEVEGERTAILRANAGPQVARLTQGASLQGWNVKLVGLDRVLVRAGDLEELIEFPKVAPLPAAPMRPPMAPQPPGRVMPR